MIKRNKLKGFALLLVGVLITFSSIHWFLRDFHSDSAINLTPQTSLYDWAIPDILQIVLGLCLIIIGLLLIQVSNENERDITTNPPHYTHQPNAPLPNFYDPLGRNHQEVINKVSSWNNEPNRDGLKLKNYESFPVKPFLINLVLLLPTILFISLLLLIGILLLLKNQDLDYGIFTGPIIILFLIAASFIFPWFWYRESLNYLQERLIQKKIATNQGWLYGKGNNKDPIDESEIYEMGNAIPQVFMLGSLSSGSLLNGEVWGSVQTQKKEDVGFWFTIFHYSYLVGYKWRHSKRFISPVFIFPLENSLITNLFSIQTKGYNRSLLSLSFYNKNPSFLSDDFKKIFTLIDETEAGTLDMNIVQSVLNTNVQSLIINLSTHHTKFNVLFAPNYLLIQFGKKIFPQTNFFKKIEIDPADCNGFQELVISLAELAEEINTI